MSSNAPQEELTGRRLLLQWQSIKTRDYYTSNPNLARVIEHYAGDAALAGMRDRLHRFGETAAAEIEPLVAECEQDGNQPVLQRWSPMGERTESIRFHPSHHRAGRLAWASGILALQTKPGRTLEQAALIYLLAHNGEGGHACPVACTAGLIKALQNHADEELRQRYLPPLLDADYDKADIGAQYITEVHGGSDVGANVVAATTDGDSWRITGEKWFCSVGNADQFLVAAKVTGKGRGTAGIGTFLVPRVLDDGRVNNFHIRRLKVKLGTRAMATGEIDFDDAIAFPVGDPRDGFRILVSEVLNTSRWVNALGSTGAMRRCYLEALSYAQTRHAFGRPIVDYPMIRETLAVMKSEEAAALSSTLYITHLVDRIESDVADNHEKNLFRFLVNANKFATSLAGSEVAHMALEVFGGNGAIEDFSPIPRLLRDNFVYESWEGAHNVLALQVLRDSAGLGLFANVNDELQNLFERLHDPALRAEAAPLRERLSELNGRISPLDLGYRTRDRALPPTTGRVVPPVSDRKAIGPGRRRRK